MYKVIEVKTDIGSLTVAVTGLDHAHISTASGTFVTVRDKEYSVHVDLFMVNGNWQVEDSSKGRASVKKPDSRSNSQSGAAPTIAAKVVEYCREALAGVLADDPKLPARAEVDSLARRIAMLTEDRNKLLSQAGAKFIEIRQLYARRNSIEKGVAA